MYTIISNIIVWTIIFLVLGNIKIRVNEKREESESGTHENWEYVIEYGKGLKVLMTIGVIFFGIIFFINFATYFWDWELGKGISLGTVIFFFIVLLFYLATFSGIVVWRIKVSGEEIYYRNYFGIVKRFRFTELDKIIEKKNHKIIVFCNNRKAFSIDNNLPLGVFFIVSARRFHVKIEQN